MKILHLASFVGNFGDVLSNKALWQYLNRNHKVTTIDPFEIRRLYQSYSGPDKMSFNDLLRYYQSSDYDRLIIGGGGFFDYWVPNTSTGTTFDLDLVLLRNLNKKVIFSSIGSFPHKEVPKGNIDRYGAFLEAIDSSPMVDLMFRNDGSISNLKNVFGHEVSGKFCDGADHAFLFVSKNDPSNESDPYFCVNIADDQITMISRYRKEGVEKGNFYRKMAKEIELVITTTGLNCVFIPHLHLDYVSLNNILQYIDPWLVRTKMSVAGFHQSGKNLDYVMGLYKYSEFNICSRFHSNVASVLGGNKTFSLCLLDRVYELAAQYSNCVPITDFQTPSLVHFAGVPIASTHFELDATVNKIGEFFKSVL